MNLYEKIEIQKEADRLGYDAIFGEGDDHRFVERTENKITKEVEVEIVKEVALTVPTTVTGRVFQASDYLRPNLAKSSDEYHGIMTEKVLSFNSLAYYFYETESKLSNKFSIEQWVVELGNICDNYNLKFVDNRTIENGFKRIYPAIRNLNKLPKRDSHPYANLVKKIINYIPKGAEVKEYYVPRTPTEFLEDCKGLYKNYSVLNPMDLSSYLKDIPFRYWEQVLTEIYNVGRKWEKIIPGTKDDTITRFLHISLNKFGSSRLCSQLISQHDIKESFVRNTTFLDVVAQNRSSTIEKRMNSQWKENDPDKNKMGLKMPPRFKINRVQGHFPGYVAGIINQMAAFKKSERVANKIAMRSELGIHKRNDGIWVI